MDSSSPPLLTVSWCESEEFRVVCGNARRERKLRERASHQNIVSRLLCFFFNSSRSTLLNPVATIKLRLSQFTFPLKMSQSLRTDGLMVGQAYLATSLVGWRYHQRTAGRRGLGCLRFGNVRENKIANLSWSAAQSSS